MRGLFAQFCCIGLLAVGLGLIVVDGGGRDLGAWDVCLLVAGLTGLGYWLLARSEFAAPLEPRLRWFLLLLLAYVGLQLVPLPVFVLRILSPAGAELVDSLGSVMPAPRFAALSVAPSTTSAFLIQAIAYTLVFLLVRELTWRSRGRWRWAVFVPLIVIAAADAAFGLSQIAPGSPAHGTYGNQDHFAGLLEMILPGAVALGLAISGLVGIGILGVATLIFLGVLYSLSKMGIVAALGGLFVMGALGLGARWRPRNRWLAVAGLAAILLLALFLLPPDRVVNGIGSVFTDDTTGEGRFPIWADSLRLIVAYPIFGVGLGNYGGAFFKYQTAVVDRTFDHTHNDYLELLSELGILGFLLLAGFVFLIFRKAVAATRRSSNSNVRYLGLGCVGGMAAIGLHSITDFNMYLPANAFVFAWIAGIAAGLPQKSRLGLGRSKQSLGDSERSEEYPLAPPEPTDPSHSLGMTGALMPGTGKIAIALSAILALYASAALVFQYWFLGNAQAERWFCRFGICNLNAVVFAGDPGTVRQGDLLEALRRYPSSPGRWSALAQAMWDSGQIEPARNCFSRAVAVAPNRPEFLYAIADFYHSQGEDNLALERTSHALQNAVELDQFFFKWFQEKKIPTSKVVSGGLPPDARVFRNYLRYLVNSKNAEAAEQVWTAMIARGYADDKSAREYVIFLAGQNRFESAARAWAAYLGDRRNGYLESNWMLNGDFESEPSNQPLDWEAWGGNGVEVARDADVKHSGAYSLRMRFEGKQNVTDAHVGQRAFVTPGRYRFEAYLKSQELTTDQGLSLQIFDATGASHLNVKTEPLLGTHDWTKVDLNVCVPPQTKWLQVRVLRQPSLKFDNLIKGTLWLDSVSLKRVGQNCAV